MSAPEIVLCSECGFRYTAEGICDPCQKGENTQAQAQAKVQDQAKAPFPSRDVVPTPGCSEDGPELYALLEAHRLGQLHPVDVELGELPPYAGHVCRAIAEHMRFLMGLRLAAGDARPLPYARSMAVNEGLAKDLATASRAIGRLVRYGVVEYAGQLEKRKSPRGDLLDGTKTYAPPGWES